MNLYVITVILVVTIVLIIRVYRPKKNKNTPETAVSQKREQASEFSEDMLFPGQIITGTLSFYGEELPFGIDNQECFDAMEIDDGQFIMTRSIGISIPPVIEREIDKWFDSGMSTIRKSQRTFLTDSGSATGSVRHILCRVSIPKIGLKEYPVELFSFDTLGPFDLNCMYGFYKEEGDVWDYSQKIGLNS